MTTIPQPSESPAAAPPRQLAILGGPPLSSEPLHVGRPNVGDRRRFIERIETMLDRRWFSNDGQFVREFERRVADYLGVKHVVATCNATVALEMAIRGLGLTGEVIVPAYTFVATAHALEWLGLTPVFADMDPATHNIDAAGIEQLITPRTSAIIGVHVWGRPCHTEMLEEIAQRHHLPVMYDAAHAFACSHRGRMIGGFGACEVLSFHATKFLNSFEGGAITTNDDALAERLRLMRNFGFAGLDRVVSRGINGKMTEACAAMGLTSLEAIDEIIACNARNYDAYRLGLAGLPGISIIEYDRTERVNYQYVVVEVDPALSPLTRDEVVEVLRCENVLARKYFWPGVHRMEPYRTLRPDQARLVPATERIAARVVVLPTGQSIDPQTASAIAGVFRDAMARASEIREAVAALSATAASGTRPA